MVLAPTVSLFFPALGLATAGAAAFFATMLGLAALPALEYLFPPPDHALGRPHRTTGRRARWGSAAPALAAGALAAVCLVAGLATDRFDAAHPAPTQLMYALDTDTGEAIWASEDAYVGAWLGQYVNERRELRSDFGLLARQYATGPAEPADLPAPDIAVTSDSTDGDTRFLALTVTPQRAARLIYVELPDAAVTRAVVQGREVAAEEIGDRFGIQFHAPPPDGVALELEIAGVGPTAIRVMDGSDGLADLPGFVPRPPDVGIRGSHTSELVLVARTVTV